MRRRMMFESSTMSILSGVLRGTADIGCVSPRESGDGALLRRVGRQVDLESRVLAGRGGDGDLAPHPAHGLPHDVETDTPSRILGFLLLGGKARAEDEADRRL